MSAVRRLSAAALLVGVLAALALPAAATDETTTDEGATETTVAEDSAPVPVVEPAVTVPPPEPEQGTADWTYRYLIPTLLALAVLVVVATTVQYFLRVVRSRYKVVE